MQRPDPVAASVLEAYSTMGLRTRVHLRGRWWTCPFIELEALVPRSGQILDLGCGHGLFSAYLAGCAAERRVTGVDIDVDKIALGTGAIAELGMGAAVDLRAIPTSEEVPAGEFDAVVIIDVLYLLGPDRAMDVLEESVNCLAPGGRIIVKEMGSSPAWKRRFAAAQEWLAVDLLGVTQGVRVEMVPLERIEQKLTGRGLQVSVHRLDRGQLHPHVAVVGTR